MTGDRLAAICVAANGELCPACKQRFVRALWSGWWNRKRMLPWFLIALSGVVTYLFLAKSPSIRRVVGL